MTAVKENPYKPESVDITSKFTPFRLTTDLLNYFAADYSGKRLRFLAHRVAFYYSKCLDFVINHIKILDE